MTLGSLSGSSSPPGDALRRRHRENLTLFARRADFRGCEIERAIFDYTEFRGEASFVNLRLGAGGASFRSAYLGDERTDLSGLASAGPLALSDAHLPALHFHWRELRDPVLAAEPDTKVLAALHARLKELGDSEGALDAGYHLARTRFGERVGAPLPRGRPDCFRRCRRRAPDRLRRVAPLGPPDRLRHQARAYPPALPPLLAARRHPARLRAQSPGPCPPGVDSRG